MESSRRFEPAPDLLPAPSGAVQTGYRLARDLVAWHGADPPGAIVSQIGPDVYVLAASDRLPASGPDDRVGPVYRVEPGGAVRVPTGRVLVRFGEADRAHAHQAELSAAGYALAEPLRFAPQAAWVRRADGDIAGSLAGADRLAQLPGVEHVEPEMLGERERR